MKTKNSKISAVVIAKNEEEKIKDCLESVRWAGEVIVVDNASTDNTPDVAKQSGARVMTASEKYTLNYSKLRNLGLKNTKGEWVLYIDADEQVSPELEGEILEKIKTEKWQESNLTAFAIPRRNFILGKELKHGGWWPDYVKRLFLKSKLKGWIGELHEEPRFDGKLGLLEKPLIHLKRDDLSGMVEKTNEWSEIEARLMYEANHPPMNVIRFLSAMFREFWLRMIRYKAYMDGVEGVIYAMYQVYSRFISYAKLWEMQIRNKQDEIRNTKI